LRARLPAVRLTVRSSLPAAVLKARLPEEVDLVTASLDPGMVMASALEVLAEESHRAYLRFHRGWVATVARQAAALAALAPDLVLADVPYLSLAAAAMAGIPAVAMCSLSWADIYHHYCGMLPGAGAVEAQIRHAYSQAAAFIQLTPHMPMEDLPRRLPIGSVARIGSSHRRAIDQRMGLAPSTRAVLIGLGGIATRLPMERWPRTPGLCWVIPSQWGVQRDDCVELGSLGLDVIDVLCSCDAVLTKPGYGTFVEAACNGIPVLYAERSDWPETPYLVDWLQRHAGCRAVSREDLHAGRLGEALEALLSQEPMPPAPATGAAEAVEYLHDCLLAT